MQKTPAEVLDTSGDILRGVQHSQISRGQNLLEGHLRRKRDRGGTNGGKQLFDVP